MGLVFQFDQRPWHPEGEFSLRDTFVSDRSPPEASKMSHTCMLVGSQQQDAARPQVSAPYSHSAAAQLPPGSSLFVESPV